MKRIPPPEHAVQCLKEEGARSVWLIQRPGEEPRTLKRWPMNAWTGVKLLLGIAQPQRQMRGARRLKSAGLDTPPVAGGWRMRRGGRLLIELEMPFVAGCTALDVLRDSTQPMSLKRTIALGLGSIVARMREAGLFHRDLKLENVVVEMADPQTMPRLWLIDPVGVGRMGKLAEETASMLYTLTVQLRRYEIVFPTGLTLACVRAATRSLQPDERHQVFHCFRDWV